MISVVVRADIRPQAHGATIRRRAGRLLGWLQCAGDDLSILLTDDAEIRSLNTAWRQKDRPTDVLSFPQLDTVQLPPGVPRLLGDVVISVETAERQVAEGCLPRLWSAMGDGERPPRWDRLDELSFLLLHGVLHLLGHDHIEADDAARMEAEEARLLPYLLNRRRGTPP